MKRILLVEDNAYILDKLARAIEEHFEKTKEEYHLTTVDTVDGALEIIVEDKREYDVLLLDFDLPNRKTGLDLLKPTLKILKAVNTKIIAISALPGNNTKLLQNGADTAIAKMDLAFVEKVIEEL